jgi:hypothetical protein
MYEKGIGVTRFICKKAATRLDVPVNIGFEYQLMKKF